LGNNQTKFEQGITIEKKIVSGQSAQKIYVQSRKKSSSPLPPPQISMGPVNEWCHWHMNDPQSKTIIYYQCTNYLVSADVDLKIYYKLQFKKTQSDVERQMMLFFSSLLNDRPGNSNF